MSTFIEHGGDFVSRRGPIGRRIQINVTDRQHAMLRRESFRTGLPVSELIRRAIDSTYRPGAAVRLRGFEVNLGVYREPDAAATGKRRPRATTSARRKARRGAQADPGVHLQRI
jgi:hypothetical protein